VPILALFDTLGGHVLEKVEVEQASGESVYLLMLLLLLANSQLASIVRYSSHQLSTDPSLGGKSGQLVHQLNLSLNFLFNSQPFNSNLSISINSPSTPSCGSSGNGSSGSVSISSGTSSTLGPFDSLFVDLALLSPLAPLRLLSSAFGT